MSTISCLLLDIGGVLLSNGWDHIFRKRAVEHFHIDGVEMEKRHKLVFEMFEEGRVTLDDYLDNVVFYTKRDFTRAEFKNFIYAQSTPDLDMIDFIKKLKSQYNLKIIAVSNESTEINEHRIKTFKLGEIFDFFVSSCIVHLRKPDVDIFQLAVEGSQVPIKKIIFIDNSQLFVDVAEEMGITSFRHTDYRSTVKKLADFGLIIKEN